MINNETSENELVVFGTDKSMLYANLNHLFKYLSQNPDGFDYYVPNSIKKVTVDSAYSDDGETRLSLIEKSNDMLNGKLFGKNDVLIFDISDEASQAPAALYENDIPVLHNKFVLCNAPVSSLLLSFFHGNSLREYDVERSILFDNCMLEANDLSVFRESNKKFSAIEPIREAEPGINYTSFDVNYLTAYYLENMMRYNGEPHVRAALSTIEKANQKTLGVRR